MPLLCEDSRPIDFNRAGSVHLRTAGKNSFLYKLIKAVKVQKNIEVKTHKLSHCSFLHIEDFISFFRSLLEDEQRPDLQIFNLNVEDINFSFLAQQLNYHFPKVSFSFIADESTKPTGQKIEVKAAKENYNWSPQHQLIKDLPSLLKIDTGKPARRKPLMEKLKAFTVSYRPFLVWGEVILGAFLTHLLTIWTSTIIEFKYIDYRLLYVVIIGSTHGLLFGILAALLAAVSGAINWYHIGLGWALLIYDVENWIPFALFILVGAVTGHVHDKTENEIGFERNQTELIHEKYEFLYNLYNEISSIKDRLREQLFGYRDSFGRFYRIANELNELDEDNIFFKALEILEDVMKNDQIAIYSLESTGNYGRLEVKSTGLERQIPRSLKLANFSQALELLKEGGVFQNKELLPNYPSYIAPIINQSQLKGLVIISECTLEITSADIIGDISLSFNGMTHEIFKRLELDGEARILNSNLTHSVELEDVADTILNRMAAVMGAKAGLLYGGKVGEMQLLSHFGVDKTDGITSILADQFGPIEKALKSEDILSYSQLDGWKWFSQSTPLGSFKPGSILLIPLMAKQQPVGLLVLACGIKKPSPQQKKTLETLRSFAAPYLDNSILHKRITELAAIDDLTNILNRRFGMRRLREEYSRASRHGVPISAVMMDIDHFKDFNDTFGHNAGDAVLKMVASTLQDNLRSEDMVCRYGGEEFLMGIAGAGMNDSALISERIRRAIETNHIRWGDKHLSVTISSGIATYPIVRASVCKELITAADKALYAAKEFGRNQVAVNDGAQILRFAELKLGEQEEKK